MFCNLSTQCELSGSEISRYLGQVERVRRVGEWKEEETEEDEKQEDVRQNYLWCACPVLLPVVSLFTFRDLLFIRRSGKIKHGKKVLLRSQAMKQVPMEHTQKEREGGSIGESDGIWNGQEWE